MKRKITAILLVVALALSLGLMPAASVGASPGSIVGLWHLDEGTGSIASDSSGNANDGTLSGGKFGNALRFDGVDDYVNVPNPSSLHITDKLTVEAWIKPTGIPDKWYGDVVRLGLGYQLCLRGDGKLEIALYRSGTWGGWWNSNSAIPIPATNFYHVAFTYDKDGGANNLKIYINGTLDAQHTAGPGALQSSGDLWISPNFWPFEGIIDEVHISNVAITSFVMTSPPVAGTDTVALWRLDESVGSTAYDETANNDGTINGASWAGPTWTSGMFDDALSFDGSDDYVDFGTGVSSLITGDYTVEAWVKPASLASGRHAAVSFSYMELGHNAGKVYFWQAYDNSWGEGYQYMSSTVLLDVTKFSHIVGVFHKDAGVDLYVDGNYIGSDTTKTGTTLNIFGTTYAGQWYQATPGGAWFDGLIDEVRIWDTAYPDLEVSADPTSDYNPVTFGHEITATVDPVLPDGATVGLEVTAGPNDDATDIGETDASGEVTLSYTDTGSSTSGSTETDTIRIWVDRNWNDTYDDGVDYAIEVTKNWVKLASLTPAVDFNPIDTEHEVEATISSEVSGIKVWFEVTGANPSGAPPDFSDPTDSNGEAHFSYTGANPGTDTIRAYFDTNGNDDYDSGEPSLTATKYWLEHYVTGGGLIETGKGKDAAKITFGGNVGFDLAGDEVGQWQCNFHNVNKDDLDKGQFHSMEITQIEFFYESRLPDADPPDADYNYAHFNANGTFNGEDGWRVRVNVTDCGEGNKITPDQIRIRLYNGPDLVYDSSDPAGDFPNAYPASRTNLDGGNIQIHPPEIPTP